jgi:hypothetical protein
MFLKMFTLSTELLWGRSKMKDTRIYWTRIIAKTRWQIIPALKEQKAKDILESIGLV